MSLALAACTGHQQSLQGTSLFLDLSSRLYVGGCRKALEVCMTECVNLVFGGEALVIIVERTWLKTTECDDQEEEEGKEKC